MEATAQPACWVSSAVTTGLMIFRPNDPICRAPGDAIQSRTDRGGARLQLHRPQSTARGAYRVSRPARRDAVARDLGRGRPQRHLLLVHLRPHDSRLHCGRSGHCRVHRSARIAVVYPIVLSTHLACIAIFGGLILITNLRLLGWALSDIPADDSDSLAAAGSSSDSPSW